MPSSIKWHEYSPLAPVISNCNGLSMESDIECDGCQQASSQMYISAVFVTLSTLDCSKKLKKGWQIDSSQIHFY